MLLVGTVILHKVWDQSGKTRWGWARWAVIACVLLLVSAATVQVAHAHPLTKAPEHCPICLLIHSALPAEATVAEVFAGLYVVHSKWYSEDIPARFGTFSLSNRPPPSSLA